MLKHGLYNILCLAELLRPAVKTGLNVWFYNSKILNGMWSGEMLTDDDQFSLLAPKHSRSFAGLNKNVTLQIHFGR